MDGRFAFSVFRSICAIGLLSVCSLAFVLMTAREPRHENSRNLDNYAATVRVATPPVLRAEAGRHKVSRDSAAMPVMSGTRPMDATASARLLESYGKLPLSFEANQGQTDEDVKFLSRGKGYTMFLTSGGAVMRCERLAKRTNNLEKFEQENREVASQGSNRADPRCCEWSW